MRKDEKPGIRITVERVSVTRIRTRSNKTYCEICGRSLGDEDGPLMPPATELRKVIEAAKAVGATDNEKGE